MEGLGVPVDQVGGVRISHARPPAAWWGGAHAGRMAVWVALVFLALTGALLVADLKRPERFLRVLTRPQWRSWLTRGSWILLAFGLAAAGLAAADLLGRPGLWRALTVPAVIAGAAAAVYTAFLFWQSKGRDLWQSPLLPVHLIVQALVAGLAVLVVGQAFSPHGSDPRLAGILGGALTIHGVLVMLELFAMHQTEDATTAARWMRAGTPGLLLLWGVIVGGIAVPSTLAAIATPGSRAAGSAAALLSLAGLALWEHLYVRAGQSVALS